MKFTRPGTDGYGEHFSPYVSLVSEDDVLSVLWKQVSSVQTALGSLSERQAGESSYAPGKWTVREVLGHVIDCERVFGYRALWVARGAPSSLPGFDENLFAKAAMHQACPLGELVEEFAALRQSHILLFRHMDQAAWERRGFLDQQPTSACAWAFIMAGHLRHHARVLAERYGIHIDA